MNNHTPGSWRYFKNVDDTFSVFSVGNGNFEEGFATNLIAKVFSEGIVDPEANARLIASAPEVYQALCYQTEALRATYAFMLNRGLDTADIEKIIGAADKLINRIDGGEGDNYE